MKLFTEMPRVFAVLSAERRGADSPPALPQRDPAGGTAAGGEAIIMREVAGRELRSAVGDCACGDASSCWSP